MLHWLEIGSIILLIIGIILSIYGFKKKIQGTIFIGGMALLTPLVYLLGGVVFLPFVPPVALAISFLGKEKKEQNNFSG